MSIAKWQNIADSKNFFTVDLILPTKKMLGYVPTYFIYNLI